jgi:hypothetical protein
VEVTVTRSDGEAQRWVGDVAGVEALARDPDVVAIQLAADPEILDAR